MVGQIRSLDKNDFEQVGSFLPEMWFSHSSNSDLISKKKLENLSLPKCLNDIIQDKKQKGFVAVVNNEVVGFIRCEIKKCPEFYTFKNELYMDDLIILKEYRDQGIATKLLEECVLFAKKNKIDLLTCKIWKFNKESKEFFKKFGFREDFSFFSYTLNK